MYSYSQCLGYGNAALQLSRSWIRDPETLPFAKNVIPHALISILQDGLWFDKLQADVTQACSCTSKEMATQSDLIQGQHRYNFGRDHGRPFSLRNGATLTLDADIPRHEVQEDTNGSAPDNAPRKGGKRKRKTNGVVEQRMEQRTNGDAMDLDHNGVSQVIHTSRGESEAVVSDMESPTIEELPIDRKSVV